MNPQLIIAAILAACGFLGGWTLQSWRYGAKETERAEQQLVAKRASAAQDVRRLDNRIGAEDAAVARGIGLRNDADGAHAALLGLSDAAAAALRAAESSQSACLERANSLSELLGAMAQAGGVIAAQADRHANDAQALIEAWPR